MKLTNTVLFCMPELLPEQRVLNHRCFCVFGAHWRPFPFFLFLRVPGGKVVDVLKQSCARRWSLKDSLKHRWRQVKES